MKTSDSACYKPAHVVDNTTTTTNLRQLKIKWVRKFCAAFADFYWISINSKSTAKETHSKHRLPVYLSFRKEGRLVVAA